VTFAARAIITLVVLLTAACTSIAESPSVEPTEETAASPSPTEEETPEEEAPPEQEEPVACEPGVLCDGPLEPGTYTTDVVGDTTVQIVLDEGWIGQILTGADAIALYPDDSEVNGLYIFRYTGEVFDDPCDIESATAVESDPAAVIAWLREHPEITGDGPNEITFGDMVGQYTNVDVQKTAECTDIPPSWVLLFVLPEVGDFHLDEDSQALVIAVAVGDETLMMVAEALEDHDAFMARARGLISTIELSAP
jgi:hypothetical protein